MLIGSDANRILIEPTLWEDGAPLAAQVDERVPTGLRVEMGRRRPDEIPQPQPAAAPATDPGQGEARPVWERTGPRVVFALFLLLAVAFLVAGVALDLPVSAVVAAIFGFCAYDLRKKAKRELR